MAGQQTLSIKLQADIDGFAADLLEKLAEQFEAAAVSCREQAETMRHVASIGSQTR